MDRNEGSKTISGWVDGATKDSFTAQVKERAHIQQRALNAALTIWVLLPEDLQASIIRHPPADYETLTKMIRDRALPGAIAALTEKQRRDLWALLVEAHPPLGTQGKGKKR